MRSVFLFRSTYLKSAMERPAWRDIEILGGQTLETLADALVLAMGWDNSHLHVFSLAQPDTMPRAPYTGSFEIMIETDGEADADHPQYLTSKVLVAHIDYGRYPRMRFEFDFGDRHEIAVDFRGVRALLKGERASQFPRVADQRGVSPEQYPDQADDDAGYGLPAVPATPRRDRSSRG